MVQSSPSLRPACVSDQRPAVAATAVLVAVSAFLAFAPNAVLAQVESRPVDSAGPADSGGPVATGGAASAGPIVFQSVPVASAPSSAVPQNGAGGSGSGSSGASGSAPGQGGGGTGTADAGAQGGEGGTVAAAETKPDAPTMPGSRSAGLGAGVMKTPAASEAGAGQGTAEGSNGAGQTEAAPGAAGAAAPSGEAGATEEKPAEEVVIEVPSADSPILRVPDAAGEKAPLGIDGKTGSSGEVVE